jgi:hypothetical protein
MKGRGRDGPTHLAKSEKTCQTDYRRFIIKPRRSLHVFAHYPVLLTCTEIQVSLYPEILRGNTTCCSTTLMWRAQQNSAVTLCSR